jgi:glycosyltransferase involved in cell wall biosynthesis
VSVDPVQKKIRVLHVITRLDPGGSTINTLETVARLDRLVYDVELVAGRTVDPLGEVADFIDQHNLYCSYIDELVRDVHLLKDVIAFFRLCGVIRHGNYDIVHTHSSKAGIIGRWAAWVCGVKKIVHTPHGHIFYGYFPKPLTQVFLWIERLSAKITTALIALTDKGIEEHVALGVGRRAQWTAIPSGIDLSVFRTSSEERLQARDEFGLQENAFVFLSAARLETIKNAQVLIAAFGLLAHEHPQARLIFVGDGPQRGDLCVQAKHSGAAGQVYFIGFRKDVARLLNAGDVFVMASMNEGMGRSVLEAMATGLPVIVSRTGGLPAIVSDGVEGFLIDPKDIRAWSEAMRQMIISFDLRQRMAIAAKARVSAEFTVETMVQKIEEVYRA